MNGVITLLIKLVILILNVLTKQYVQDVSVCLTTDCIAEKCYITKSY